MKVFIRGIYICEISKRKTKNQELTVTHQNRVGETERAYIVSLGWGEGSPGGGPEIIGGSFAPHGG